MNKYLVYIELYGKKMKVEINANTQHEAAQTVRGDLKIHKIDKIKDDSNDVFNNLMDIFGFKYTK